MKNKFFISILLMLFIMNFVSAYTTEINIKTIPGYEIRVTFMDPDITGFSALDTAVTLSDKNGDAQIVFASEDNSFDLAVLVKDLATGSIAASKDFRENFIAGEVINIEVFPNGKNISDYVKAPVVEVNVTEVNDTEVAEEVAEEEFNEPGIVGLVVSGTGDFLSKNLLYIIGGLVVIVLFSGGVVLAKKGKLHMPKMHFLHSGGKSSGSPQSDRELIEDAEEKIKEAQEEIAKIRKEGKGELTEKEKKIIEAKKKLIEDQKELQDLTDEKD